MAAGQTGENVASVLAETVLCPSGTAGAGLAWGGQVDEQAAASIGRPVRPTGSTGLGGEADFSYWQCYR
jgi:hypothetical protein